jgi:hypothetical protein
VSIKGRGNYVIDTVAYVSNWRKERRRGKRDKKGRVTKSLYGRR